MREVFLESVDGCPVASTARASMPRSEIQDVFRFQYLEGDVQESLDKASGLSRGLGKMWDEVSLGLT